MAQARDRITADLREATFDQFVDFLFDRKPPSDDETFAALHARGEAEKWHPWYWQTEVMFDPRQVCEFYTRLFLQPAFLMERFSRAQLELGFWAIHSSPLNCSAYRTIWSQEVPFPAREECVRSMFYLFRDLFSSEPLHDAVCMWWDSFCYSWHCGNRKRERGGEDLTMQDVMFETLSQILSLPSEICQGAALHGLSHLHHPKTSVLIEDYLERNPSLGEEWRATALAVTRFELM